MRQNPDLIPSCLPKFHPSLYPAPQSPPTTTSKPSTASARHCRPDRLPPAPTAWPCSRLGRQWEAPMLCCPETPARPPGPRGHSLLTLVGGPGPVSTAQPSSLPPGHAHAKMPNSAPGGQGQRPGQSPCQRVRVRRPAVYYSSTSRDVEVSWNSLRTQSPSFKQQLGAPSPDRPPPTPPPGLLHAPPTPGIHCCRW